MANESKNEQALPKITAKTTRPQLIEAYNKALEIIAQRSVDKAGETKTDREKQIVEKVSGITPESIIKGLADVQISIGKSITDLEQKLITESNKFIELQEAIALETSKLKDIHDVEYQCNALAALIHAQEDCKQSFEREMEEKRRSLEEEIQLNREEWKKEQTGHETAIKEREAQMKKQRERDEEEYKYRLNVERRKDADDYVAKKAKLEQELSALKQQVEKEIAEKKEVLKIQEKEVEALRKRTDNIPAEIEEAVKKAETEVRTTMKQQFDIDKKLASNEVEAEKKLNALKISNLEQIIVKQQAQINELTKQLQTATKQVQEMAVKAIEGASGIKTRAISDLGSTSEKRE
jgi:hypothetical protein